MKNVLYNWDLVNNLTEAWFNNKDNESNTVICCIVHRVEVLQECIAVNEVAAKIIHKSSCEEGHKHAILDSGSTRHICPHKMDFETFTEIPCKSLTVANKQTFKAIGKETLVIQTPDGTGNAEMKLTNVLYTPNVQYMIISVGWLDKSGYMSVFTK